MDKSIKNYLSNQTVEQTNEENQHQFNNNDYDLLLSSIYIISEYTKYSFNEIILFLGLEDIIYNENIN